MLESPVVSVLADGVGVTLLLGVKPDSGATDGDGELLALGAGATDVVALGDGCNVWSGVGVADGVGVALGVGIGVSDAPMDISEALEGVGSVSLGSFGVALGSTLSVASGDFGVSEGSTDGVSEGHGASLSVGVGAKAGSGDGNASKCLHG